MRSRPKTTPRRATTSSEWSSTSRGKPVPDRRQSSPSAPRPDDPEALFLEFSRSRDPALREQLVQQHESLARFLANKFANRGEPLDDLVQVAMVGLIHA